MNSTAGNSVRFWDGEGGPGAGEAGGAPGAQHKATITPTTITPILSSSKYRMARSGQQNMNVQEVTGEYAGIRQEFRQEAGRRHGGPHGDGAAGGNRRSPQALPRPKQSPSPSGDASLARWDAEAAGLRSTPLSKSPPQTSAVGDGCRNIDLGGM